MEIWRIVKNTNNKIFVSNKGRIKSVLRDERILKPQINSKGYERIRITIDRVKKSFKVHRLVAEAFIPNPDNLPQVNHIDGNKRNNVVENLEWVTNKANAHHAIKNGLWKSVYIGAARENESRKKPIIGIAPCGLRKEFNSVAEAERFMNSRHISDVLNGKRKHVKHWTFMYI